MFNLPVIAGAVGRLARHVVGFGLAYQTQILVPFTATA